MWRYITERMSLVHSAHPIQLDNKYILNCNYWYSNRGYLEFEQAKWACNSIRWGLGPQDRKVHDMASIGQTANPYSISFSSSSTASEFTTPHGCFRVELRKGVYDGAIWVWVRVTTLKSSNYNPNDSTAKVVTPYGTVSGLVSGMSNTTIGSSSCTRCICIGASGRAVQVTYHGACAGETSSKTVSI